MKEMFFFLFPVSLPILYKDDIAIGGDTERSGGWNVRISGG